MGYTHYWTLKKEANDPVRFKEAIELFKKLWAAAPKTITGEAWDKVNQTWVKKRFKKEKLLKGGLGKGEPTITDTCLRFNGDAEYELDHETFSIGLDSFNDDWCRQDNGDVWDFCKTARKPYDLAVCLALMAFKDVFGDDFEYSSDGVTRESITKPENLEYWKRIDWEPEIEYEWKRAYKVYDKYMADQYSASVMAR